MARQTSNRGNQTAAQYEWVTVEDGVNIKLSKGDYFSLQWFGAVIHGCAVRDGRNGPFISWPSFRGSDGQYVKRAYVYAGRGSEDERLLEAVVTTVIEERKHDH